MASEGFLTSVYSIGDVYRPTFFELLAQDQLVESLHPAARFVAGALAESAPPRLAPLLARWELIYDSLILVLEWRHLRNHGASFGEHFYGLRRQEAAPSKNLTALEEVELRRKREAAPNLKLRQQLASLAVLVLLPWVRRRCEARFREAERIPQRSRTTSQQVWVAVYPWIHAVGCSLAVAYKVLYLMDQTDVWSPSLHALRLTLVRHMPDPPGEEEGPQSVLERLTTAASALGSGALWSTIYLMQFGQWWFAREHLLQPYQPKKVPPAPPPRPPYQDVVLPRAPSSAANNVGRLVLLPEDRTVCALCHRMRQNPALSSAGYCFCYTCLIRHVQDFGHCPVSGRAMKVEEVRRVRED